MFLRELTDKHIIDDAEFLVDGPSWLDAALFDLGMHFRHETFGERNPVELTSKRLHIELARFPIQFPARLQKR